MPHDRAAPRTGPRRWRGRRATSGSRPWPARPPLLLPVAGPLDPAAAGAPTARQPRRPAGGVRGGSGTPVPAVTGPLPVTADVVPLRRRRPPAGPAGPGPRRLRRGGVPRQRAGQRVRLAGPGPGGRPHRLTSPTRPGCSCGGRRTGRGFSGNVVVEMLNPSNLFDLNIGWALTHDQLVHDGRRLGGHHRQAHDRRGAQGLRPGAVRRALVRQPAAAGRPGQLPDAQHAHRRRQLAARPRTAWSGTCTARSRAWLHSRQASNPLTYGTARGTRKPVRAPVRLRVLADGRLPVHLHQRDRAAGDARPAGGRCSTGTSSRVAGGAFAGTVPINQCAPSIAGHRPAQPDPQRRRAGHPHHVAVRLPARDRVAAQGQRRARRPVPALRGAGHGPRDARGAVLLGGAGGHRQGRSHRSRA